MRKMSITEQKRLRANLEHVTSVVSMLREKIWNTASDQDQTITAEYEDISALESALIELQERFTHLWDM